MSAIVLSRNTTQVLTLDRIKQQCRVDYDDDDELLLEMAEAVQTECEARIEGPLLTTPCKETLNKWPVTGSFVLTIARALAIQEMRIKVDGVHTPFTDFHTVFQDEGKLMCVAPNTEWPRIDKALNAVEIDYTAGFGDTPDSVPQDIKQWMLYTIGTMYIYRENFVTGGASVHLLPNNFVDNKIIHYKPVRVNL